MTTNHHSKINGFAHTLYPEPTDDRFEDEYPSRYKEFPKLVEASRKRHEPQIAAFAESVERGKLLTREDADRDTMVGRMEL